jgi:hypothetical protein
VVVDVAIVALRVGRHAGDREHAGGDAREEVALRGDHFAQAHEPSLDREDLLELGVVGSLEDAVLDRVDAVVELAEQGEEAVDQRIDHRVQDEGGVVGVEMMRGDAGAQVAEGRAVVVMHGHEVVLGEKAVHLDEVVLVAVRAVDHQHHVVVVGVQLRALTEVLRILQRDGVEAEDVAQQGEACGVGPVDVEPEEAVGLQARRDRVAVGRHDGAVGVDEELGGRRSRGSSLRAGRHGCYSRPRRDSSARVGPAALASIA